MKKSFYKLNLALFLLCFLSVIVACKPSIPSKFIQPDELEDILYEYHLAEGMSMLRNDSIAFYNYKKAVLQKYGVTSEQFDASLEYYLSHADKLKSIYKNIAERLEQDVKANGGTLGEFANASLTSSNGDAVNVWRGDKAFVLTTKKPFNVYSFAIKADSSYHAGDRLTFGFNTRFISKNGMKDGTIIMSVRFNNDSIAFQTQKIIGAETLSVSVEDTKRAGIKSIKGSIFWTGGTEYHAKKEEVLQLMAVFNPFLIRVHVPENTAPLNQDVSTIDSLKVLNNTDINVGKDPSNTDSDW